jgi:hypothetical protein
MKSTLHKRGLRAVLSMMMMVVVIAAAFPLTKATGVTTARAESRAIDWLQNGSFEIDTDANGVPDNWTVTNSRVDLGITVLGGCTSVDTVDYAGIWTRSSLYGAVPVFPFPSNPSASKPTNDDSSGFSGTFTSSVMTSVDAVSPALAPTDGTNTWYMRIASGTGIGGHVVHGGSLVSDEFKGVAGQVITMDWFSADGGDDFAVLGYLLNTTTCAQTTVFETTGSSISSWQNAFVTIPATAGTYRFVFVSGTFDKTGGTASGSKFWLDNISQGDPQTITMDLTSVVANKHATYTTAPFSIASYASTPSGLSISYASDTPGVCTISGSTVTLVASGNCIIRASQPGGTDGTGTLWASAPSVTSSFTVTATAATAQTITFAALTAKETTAANFTVSATTDSPLTVTYRVTPSTSAGVCTVSSVGLVDVTGAGLCSIDAVQAGGVDSGTTYAPATTVPRTFYVLTSTPQTITFATITDRLSTAGTFSVSPTATSGLAVTVTSQTPSICTMSSGTVTLGTDGTCTLRAAQAGADVNADFKRYTAAPNVDQSFKVLATQTISFGALGEKFASDANFTVTGTASSGLPLTFSTTSAATICTVTSAGLVNVVGPGICSITANQVGGLESGSGRTYGAAPAETQTFMVNAAQTITFNPTDKVYTAAPYNLTATIAPATGFALTYTTSTPSVCTVTSSGNVDLLDVGVCTVTVTAAGGTSGGVTYGPATVTKSFDATAAVQTVTFPTLPEWRLYEGDEITPAAVTASGLAVTYTTTTPLVCSIVAGKISVVGLGKCTVKATAAAGTILGVKYGASAVVQREFFITDTKPTATFTPTNTHTPTPTQTPTPIPLLLKKGAIGASFVLGLLQNDTLVTWGMGREGQSSIPPCCGSAIQDIAVGTNFALALKGGKVFGWGANTKGQLRFPNTVQSGIKAVAAGGAHGLALTNAGKVIAWGDNGLSQARVPALKKVVTSVVGGNNHTVVLFADGTVSAWGSNASKQSSPPTTLTGVTQIAAGLDHNLALTNKGTVIGWGGNTFSQSVIPRNVIDIKQVSAGTQFSMAVKKNGEVIAWGRNDYNQTKIPREYTNIYSAFAGYANTILGLRNGRIIVLGDQNNGVAVSRTPTRTATPTP